MFVTSVTVWWPNILLSLLLPLHHQDQHHHDDRHHQGYQHLIDVASVRTSIRGLEFQSINNQGVLKILPLLKFVFSKKNNSLCLMIVKTMQLKIRVWRLDKLSNTLDFTNGLYCVKSYPDSCLHGYLMEHAFRIKCIYEKNIKFFLKPFSSLQWQGAGTGPVCTVSCWNISLITSAFSFNNVTKSWENISMYLEHQINFFRFI